MRKADDSGEARPPPSRGGRHHTVDDDDGGADQPSGARNSAASVASSSVASRSGVGGVVVPAASVMVARAPPTASNNSAASVHVREKSQQGEQGSEGRTFSGSTYTKELLQLSHGGPSSVVSSTIAPSTVVEAPSLSQDTNSIPSTEPQNSSTVPPSSFAETTIPEEEPSLFIHPTAPHQALDEESPADQDDNVVLAEERNENTKPVVDEASETPAVGAFRVLGRHAESYVSEDFDDDPTTIVPPGENPNYTPSADTAGGNDDAFLVSAVLVEEEHEDTTNTNATAQEQAALVASAPADGNNSPVLVHAQLMNNNRRNYVLIAGFLVVVGLLAVVLLLVVVRDGDGGGSSPGGIRSPGETPTAGSMPVPTPAPVVPPTGPAIGVPPQPLPVASPIPSETVNSVSPSTTTPETVTSRPTLVSTLSPTAVPIEYGSTKSPVASIDIPPSIGGLDTLAPTGNQDVTNPTRTPTVISATQSPTDVPTRAPVALPIGDPVVTAPPSVRPSPAPSPAPVDSTVAPSLATTPTGTPTTNPTETPTMPPTHKPTLLPTLSPTRNPTLSPTHPPTLSPTDPKSLLADGEACDSSSECLNGACARYFANEDKGCCPQGGMLERGSVNYCVDLPLGASCVDNYDCQSNICIAGACANTRLADLAVCQADENCANFRCGKSDLSQFASAVCCAEGNALYLDVSWTYRDQWICRDMPSGAMCGTNDQSCANGVCLSGRCANSTVADGETCDSARDCSSRVCGLKEESQYASKVCCPEGKYLVVDVDWQYSDEVVCRMLPVGSKCSSDELCENGRCFGGECIESALADGKSCNSNADCANRLCAKEEASQSSPKICCVDGDGLYTDVDYQYSDEWICSHIKEGNRCVHDRSCESGICVLGACANATLADGERCDSNRDCSNRRCARGTYSEDALKQCCQDGDALYTLLSWSSYSSDWICSHLAVGENCPLDRSCESGRCALGKCIAQPLADNERCDSHHDCVNNRCGLQENVETAPKVCCPDGRAELVDVSWTYEDQEVCSSPGSELVSGVEDGQACTLSSDCESGSCGRNEYAESASLICCAGGERYTLDVTYDYRDYDFCGNRPRGTLCGDDRMCSSGLCIDGSCADSQLMDGQRCTKNSDCLSMVCAKESYTESSGSICCADGEAYLLDVPYSSYSDVLHCGNLIAGKQCAVDRQCLDLCIKGECSSEQLANGETCSKDSDCSSGTCARDSFTENSGQMCCDEAYTLGVPWTYSERRFCAGLSMGTICGEEDRLCASGICANGVCATSRLADNSRCTKDSNCLSSICSRESYTEESGKICCREGKAYSLSVPWTYSSVWFCANLEVDSICGDDRQCAGSAFCVRGKCGSPLGDGETCSKDTDCQNGACAQREFLRDAPKECCRDGEKYLLDVPWTYQDEEFCGNLPSGALCSTKYQCASKVCFFASKTCK